jgi:hypothetical protein
MMLSGVLFSAALTPVGFCSRRPGGKVAIGSASSLTLGGNSVPYGGRKTGTPTLPAASGKRGADSFTVRGSGEGSAAVATVSLLSSVCGGGGTLAAAACKRGGKDAGCGNCGCCLCGSAVLALTVAAGIRGADSCVIC